MEAPRQSDFRIIHHPISVVFSGVHIFRTLSLSIPLTLILCFAGDRSFAVADPGIAKEKPAEGRSIETDQGYMVPYRETIPSTDVSFEMIPIPGGTFKLGSPASEVGRNPDEGPQVIVEVPPMWVGRCEVTWAEYKTYMDQYEPFKHLNGLRHELKSAGDAEAGLFDGLKSLLAYLKSPWDVDAVTCPTPLYDSSFTYEPGEDPEQPAITMTQYAAKQYTKWLSGITGRQYRLPSEAEWEYFARAGTTTAYSFGEDPAQLSDYAWYSDNSDDQTHAVGSKEPNPWGLYDVHGNAAEWVLDQYAEDYYSTLAPGPVEAAKAVNWPTELFPRVVRGGCWFDDAEQLRCAARHFSMDEDWSMSDPNLPISPWWFTEYESQCVGIRIVRPLKKMDDNELARVWDADIEITEQDVADRLLEGRGTSAPANALLPAALNELKQAEEKLQGAGLVQ